jgi:hypothetical protein
MILRPLLCACLCAGSAAAAVHDRGGGLLYDDVLDITWLQDANYAKTVKAPDATPEGAMDFKAAQAWVAGLVYHDAVRGRDWDDWRLPRIRPLAGERYSGRFRLDGSSDEGYNITSPRSELAYMYHVNLKLTGYYNKDGSVRSDFGAGRDGKWGGSHEVGPVRNLMAVIYWSGSDGPSFPERNGWMFNTYWGVQNFYNKWDKLFVWPVRDGDVGAPQR